MGHYGKFYRTELNALLRLLDAEGIDVAAVFRTHTTCGEESWAAAPIRSAHAVIIWGVRAAQPVVGT